MSCGAGCRCGLDPELLWLWCRLAATALIQPLAWEPPYASGSALKRQKKRGGLIFINLLKHGEQVLKTVTFILEHMAHSHSFGQIGSAGPIVWAALERDRGACLKSQHHHTPATCPWERDAAILFFSFLICKIRIIKVPTSQGCRRD